MQEKKTPAVDGRYWVAIVVASVLGTSFGDFVSNTLKLGFGGAALTVGSVLALIFLAECILPWRNVAWYWGAVVFTRTAATDIGDFSTRTVKLGNGPVSAILAVCLVVYLFAIWRLFGPSSLSSGVKGGPKRLPKTNTRYWLTMLAVSTFATVCGDFVADEMGFGLGRASLILGALLALVAFFEISAPSSNEFRYWGVIALVRTAGTCIADYLTEEDGLNLGFGVGAALVCTLLLVILLLPRKARLQEELPEMTGECL